ncbi:MAG TPA: hypothetical protein VFX23_07330 [Limnobacter sp.]|uniref:hypothetical protein n=1 Tax=Limnobacter sp. TaxID=2003368 RepID=UPI002E363C13|nr:hypothetical protein [Limnobacter sp.]HEX5485791.1 hypothetical protein [Limnobacter sp.]
MTGIKATGSEKPFEVTPGWQNGVEKRIAKKAGMKALGGGTYGRKTWGTKVSQALSAGRGAAVVGKAYCESNHYMQAALFREAHRAKVKGASNPINESINSPAVKNRVYRQDNIRFRPEIFQHSDKNPIAGTNRLAYRLSRVSHAAHGMCEAMAAPTGFSQVMLKNMVTPHATQKGLVNRIGMLATLVPIGIALSTCLSVVKKSGHAADHLLSFGLLGQAVTYSVGSLAVAFSSFSAVSGGLSAITGALSQALIKKEDLNAHQQQAIVKEKRVLLNKLDGLLSHVSRGTHGHAMLCRAMNRKIGQAFRHSETGEPFLLAQLIDNYDRSAPQAERFSRIAETVGEYLADVPQLDADQKGGLIGKLRCHLNEKAHLQRERHFVGLCDLVDHVDLIPGPTNTKDLRRAIEGKMDEEGHPALAWALQVALRRFPGFKGSSMDHNLTARQDKNYKKKLTADLNAAYARGEKTSHIDRILSYPHQYTRATVICARVGEALRRVSLDVLLARNAQISRGFFNLFIRLSNLVSSNPVSRTMIQGVARFCGGAVLTAIWAGLTAATGGALAALHLAQITGAGFKVGKAVWSFLSAAFMMVTANAVGLGFSVLARVLAVSGGYKGGLDKPVPSQLDNPATARWHDQSTLALVK